MSSRKYVAFLRAINVGGHAIVKMTDLRDAFASAGAENARTFIQSGSVVFEAADENSDAVFQKIRVKVRALVGGEPGILFRTMSELEAILKASPFKALETDRAIKLYVVFLSDKPKTKPRFPLVFPKDALEAVGVKNLHVFVVSRRKPNGFYGFPNNFIEKELGVSATTRNLSTLKKIVEFARIQAEIE